MADRAIKDERGRDFPEATLGAVEADGRRAPVAVTLAAALAAVVAMTAMAVADARAAPAPGAGDERPAPVQTYPSGSTRTADLVLTAPRDGLYVVAPAPQADKSVAMVLVGGMFLAMAAGTTAVWRALGRSVLASARRPPVRRGRSD